GFPIIASNVPGCRECVNEGENGFLCEAANTESLIVAVEKIINTNVETKVMFSHNSRKLAEEKFSNVIVLTRYQQVVNN
ncbi:MAG: glycosyltransferase, partial [Cytophagales bacterium]